MTTKSDFDPKEWSDLMYFACIGLSYKYSTRDIHALSDMVGFLREMLSAHTFLTSAMNKYGNLELLREVINDLVSASKSRQELLNEDFNPFKNLEPTVARANQILADKATSEEARAMRAFTYELAFEIAKAAGDGFLGTGTKVSQSEAEFLSELKSHLLDV
ncbi:MAG: hypothetical protein CVV41_07815 [Candidatus Riflebacteria bacterium HGW-Riflebacteria-1]|jgi:predicted RNA-binding Zn ribbon-like protein|nr:MAG: hypothetical protein CVV41_07815 [Candidatus Riflebacteria bacterium HGW-Riflebacteria-1]